MDFINIKTYKYTKLKNDRSNIEYWKLRNKTLQKKKHIYFIIEQTNT